VFVTLAFGSLFRLADGPLLGERCWIWLRCCWLALDWIFRALFALCLVLLGAWFDALLGMVSRLVHGFLAALLTATLPLQVFVPGDSVTHFRTFCATAQTFCAR
jgi:hypothetical protein